MKNYDYELFYFGKKLGFGQSGNIFEARLFKESGTLKMVGLYKDDIKLEEMLNEIKIYDIILKSIQGIHIPKLLKFGFSMRNLILYLHHLQEDHLQIKEKKLQQ